MTLVGNPGGCGAGLPRVCNRRGSGLLEKIPKSYSFSVTHLLFLLFATSKLDFCLYLPFYLVSHPVDSMLRKGENKLILILTLYVYILFQNKVFLRLSLLTIM